MKEVPIPVKEYPDPRTKNVVFDLQSVAAFSSDYALALSKSIKAVDASALGIAIASIENCAKRGGTVYFVGNGGSASICNHAACDFTNGTRCNGHPRIKAVSLVSNIATYSAIANDTCFELVFSAMIESQMKPEDVLIAVSSSGDSANIINAVDTARKRGAITIGLSGFSGGQLRSRSQISIHLPFENYGIIEDGHSAILHIIVQLLANRRELTGGGVKGLQEVPESERIPVAILLGGRGTRLGLEGTPKPMVPFCEIPLLERTVRVLAEQGFTNLIFLTGFMSRSIEDHFGDGDRFGVCIQYSREAEPLGTALATQAARRYLDDEFLLVYGDTVFDIDLDALVAAGRRNGGLGTLLVHPNDHPNDSDLVVCGPLNIQISTFFRKPSFLESPQRNLVNAGLYFLKASILEMLPKSAPPLDWGRDVFPQLLHEGAILHAYRSSEYIKDIGTPKRLAEAELDFQRGIISSRSKRRKQRAIFLDRDGVINHEIGGVQRPEELVCLPGVARTIASINHTHFLVIGVSNQPGLTKGFLKFEDLDAIHAEMDRQLVAEGAFLDDILFCPHHPETGFDGEVAHLKRMCSCRKPKPGLLFQAAEQHNIALGQSFIIGDRVSDLQAGRAAGVKTVLVHRNGSEHQHIEEFDTGLADYVAQDLAAAWSLLREMFSL